MSGQVMRPLSAGTDVFTVLVTTETTEEELAEQVEAAQAWLVQARETEERRVAAQAAYDAIMNPAVDAEVES